LLPHIGHDDDDDDEELMMKMMKTTGNDTRRNDAQSTHGNNRDGNNRDGNRRNNNQNENLLRSKSGVPVVRSNQRPGERASPKKMPAFMTSGGVVRGELATRILDLDYQ
jgi:hypothetical protein